MANLRSLLKRRYAPLVNPVAPEKSIAKAYAFETKLKTGEDYRFPLRFGLEQGFTRNADHTAATMNSAVDAVREVASLQGSEIAGTAQFSYGDMSTLAATKGDSDEAYDQAVGTKIMDLADGAAQHLDMDLLYGCGTSGLANIGVVNAVAVAAAAGVVTVNITRATFIPGFWIDAANAQLDFYTAGGALVNTTGAMTVTGVSESQCRVTVTGAVADAAAIAATNVIHFRGARTKSMVGIQAILENTTTLFGINAATYPQWRAVNYAVGGALSFDKVMEGLARLADHNLDGGVDLWVTNAGWTDLMTDEAALRRHLGSEGNGKVKTGYGELEFHGPGNNIVTIKTYRYLKQGLAIALPKSGVHRIGSNDISFALPGSKGNEFFYQELPTQLGASIRVYTDQAIVLDEPFKACLFTGVQSAADVTPS
jgi:hypothetical protein